MLKKVKNFIIFNIFYVYEKRHFQNSGAQAIARSTVDHTFPLLTILKENIMTLGSYVGGIIYIYISSYVLVHVIFSIDFFI